MLLTSSKLPSFFSSCAESEERLVMLLKCLFRKRWGTLLWSSAEMNSTGTVGSVVVRDEDGVRARHLAGEGMSKSKSCR